MVTESPVDWVISHTYTKTVTTDRATYSFPYYVPIREDVMNSSNFNLLTFEAFEPLTVGFTVTDYLEDPTWWHNKIIPPTIWEDEPTTRRTVSNLLYEHVIGADDDSHIGDPGLYIGADEEGNVFTPTEPGTLTRVSLYRHNVAFFLFDQYLKMHMYYIEIDGDLELDDEFKTDLEELVLVAKPSYTYTIVEPNEAFIDDVILTDVFSIPEFGLHFGGDYDDGLDSLHLANNELKIGDTDFPWYIGDFFRYKNGLTETTASSYANPVPVGTIFTVPNIPSGAGLLNLVIDGTRTVDGDMMLEGRDYTVNWLAEDPPGTPNPDAWQVEILSEYNQPGVGPTDPISCTVWYAERLNGSYDTTLGWTPIHIGGLNPWYIRMGALDPSSPTFAAEWEALRTEYVDRPVQLTIVDGGGSYTYP